MQGKNHITGSLREHLVAVDLLKRGFEVYIGSGHSSFDLVACRDGHCTRMEVKGKPNAGLTGPSCSMGNGKADYRKFDVLAVVDYSDQIHYRPSALFKPEGTPVWELVKDNMEYDNNTPHKIIALAKQIQEAQ